MSSLSKNFTLSEMLESGTARRMKIEEQFAPDSLVTEHLTELCTHILQPLRDYIGAINISSGYRCPRLNKAIGGASNSQHLYGQAADIKGVGRVTNKMLYDSIIELKLPFDQIINEYDFAWVHVSYGPRHRRQQLTIK